MRYIAENRVHHVVETFNTYNELLTYFSDIGGIIDVYDFLTFKKKTIIINTYLSQYYTTEKIDQIIWF
jgi:hypothetical protein